MLGRRGGHCSLVNSSFASCGGKAEGEHLACPGCKLCAGSKGNVPGSYFPFSLMPAKAAECGGRQGHGTPLLEASGAAHQEAPAWLTSAL